MTRCDSTQTPSILYQSRFLPTHTIGCGTIRLGMTARLCYVYVRRSKHNTYKNIQNILLDTTMDVEFPLMTHITSRLCTKPMVQSVPKAVGRRFSPLAVKPAAKFLPRNPQLVLLGRSCCPLWAFVPLGRKDDGAASNAHLEAHERCD